MDAFLFIIFNISWDEFHETVDLNSDKKKNLWITWPDLLDKYDNTTFMEKNKQFPINNRLSLLFCVTRGSVGLQNLSVFIGVLPL